MDRAIDPEDEDGARTLAEEIIDEPTARLFAAAPDLLEACKFLMAEFKKYGHLHDSEVEALAVVINKADGSPLGRFEGGHYVME